MTQHTLPTILIVDDTPTNLHLLSMLLEREGYTIETATSGRQALQMARHTLPDLIILDVLLPDIDGTAVYEQLRDDPHTAMIPIIFASAIGRQQHIRDHLPEVTNAYWLTKPFRLEEVLSVVNAVLPLTPDADAANSTRHAAVPTVDQAESTLTSGTILVVDDTPSNLNLLTTLLTEHGHTVRTATTGARAIRSVSTDPPDIMLLDIMLPDMDGYAVCEQLQANPRTASVPVIFMSALSEVMDKLRAFSIGAVDYITKPFQAEEVLVRVRTHLRVQQATTRYQQAIRDLEQRNHELRLITRLSTALQQVQSVAGLWEQGMPFLYELLPARDGALYLWDEDAEHLTLAHWWGEAPPAAQTIAPEACWTFAGTRVHLTTNPAHTLACQHIAPTSTEAVFCIQLATGPQRHGLLTLAVTQDRITDTSHYERIIVMVAELLSFALANLHLREDLHRQAVHDSLTGLFNRRYLDEMLVRELARALRESQSVSLIIFDIDHFKHYNDTHGHAVGDTLLQTIGSTLLQEVRTSDIACRYGGDELVIVLPQTSLATAQRRAEQLCARLSQLSIEHEGHLVNGITCSAGVAAAPLHGTTPDHLLAAADKALYRAKLAGRNQVQVAASTVRQQAEHW